MLPALATTSSDRGPTAPQPAKPSEPPDVPRKFKNTGAVPSLPPEQRGLTSGRVELTMTADGADPGDVFCSLSRPNVGCAAIPLDAQPVFTDRREMRAARDEGHIRSGLRE